MWVNEFKKHKVLKKTVISFNRSFSEWNGEH